MEAKRSKSSEVKSSSRQTVRRRRGLLGLLKGKYKELVSDPFNLK
jgi:hypothetical protein